MIIAILISILFITFYIPAMLVNIKTYKHIRSTYGELSKIKFFELQKNFIIGKSTITDNHVIWFRDSGDIKLNDRDSYIFNGLTFLVDPYYLYWYIKFNRWFNTKLVINELEEADSDSL